MNILKKIFVVVKGMGWMEVIFVTLVVFTIVITGLTFSRMDANWMADSDNLEKDSSTSQQWDFKDEIISQDFQIFSFKNNNYSAFVFDSRKHNISFFLKDETGQRFTTIRNLDEKLEQDNVNLQFATNAGIFRKNFEPEGLFINEGHTTVELNLKEDEGNFYLKPNGVFYILADGSIGILESHEYSEAELQPEYATQSGPLLIGNDIMNKAFNEGSSNRFIRSGVGIISPFQAVFLLSSEPVNYFDFSTVFRDHYNCKNALYLDGAISEMYVDGMKNFKGERSFSGIIGITKK